MYCRIVPHARDVVTDVQMPDRIKVLHVCTIPLTARTFISSLARYLDSRAFEVTIACSDDRKAESGSAMKEMRQAGFRMKPMPIPRTSRPFADAWATLKLYQFMRAERFAIVHTQTSKAGFIGRCAARLARVPVVIHTAQPFSFHPYLSPWVLHLYVTLERWAAGWTDLIMVPTEAVRTEGLRYRIAPTNKFVTISNGIDLNRFSSERVNGATTRSQWGIHPDEPVVGTVTRLVPDKGLECFLAAAARVVERHPRTRFLIVGGGPLQPALEQRAGDLGIANQVIFTGVRSDVPEHLAAMDLFVLPTLREGFGVVFAEAMAMGKVVVGSNIGAVSEVVADGESGLLLPPDDVDGFAKATVSLLDDEPRRRAMGVAGRRRVEQYFDERKKFQRTETEYRRLLNEKGWDLARMSCQ